MASRVTDAAKWPIHVQEGEKTSQWEFLKEKNIKFIF